MGQHGGAGFMIHLNHPHTRDPLNYIGCIEFSPMTGLSERGSIFFYNIKSLNLWAMGEGVRGMLLTLNLISGPIENVYFHPSVLLLVGHHVGPIKMSLTIIGARWMHMNIPFSLHTHTHIYI